MHDIRKKMYTHTHTKTIEYSTEQAPQAYLGETYARPVISSAAPTHPPPHTHTPHTHTHTRVTHTCHTHICHVLAISARGLALSPPPRPPSFHFWSLIGAFSSFSLPPSLPPSLIYAGMTCRSVAASEEASGMTLVVLVVGG